MIDLFIAGIVGLTVVTVFGIRMAERVAHRYAPTPEPPEKEPEEEEEEEEEEETKEDDAIPDHVLLPFQTRRGVLQRQREDWIATIHNLSAHGDRMDYTKLVHDLDEKLLVVAQEEAAAIQRFVSFRERRRVLERMREGRLEQQIDAREQDHGVEAIEHYDQEIERIDRELLDLAKEEATVESKSGDTP